MHKTSNYRRENCYLHPMAVCVNRRLRQTARRTLLKYMSNNFIKLVSMRVHAALQRTGGANNLASSIQEILAEVDKDGDGRIDYQEFCDMMRGQAAPTPPAFALACSCSSLTCVCRVQLSRLLCYFVPWHILLELLLGSSI